MKRDIEKDKESILDVLEGKITSDNDPGFFDDDLLYFAVQNIEENDKVWLLNHLRNPEYNKKFKESIVVNMSSDDKIDMIRELSV